MIRDHTSTATGRGVIFAPSLADAFEHVGMPYPAREPEPGRLCRFQTNGRKADSAGWVKLFPDQDGAVFGDWRDGSAYTWQRKHEGPPPDPAELAAIRQRAEQIRKAAQAERDADHAKAASKAADAWQAATPASEHAYLSAKGIKAHIARERGGQLMVPVFGNDGSIQSVQTIGGDGSKRFMTSGKMAGGRCWIGEPTEGGPILITEGFATGASLHEATGSAVCIAFTADNLVRVAKDIRARYPEAQMVVCGDDDRRTDGNPGTTKAQEAAKVINALTVFPTFAGDDGTDFNDMAQQAGLDAVRKAVSNIGKVESEPRYKLLTGACLAALPPIKWRIKGVLPARGVAAIFGPSGSGKSFLVFDAVCAISDGTEWFGYRVKPAPVVYVALEGQAGFKLRAEAWRAKHERDLPANLFMVLQPFRISEVQDVADLAAVTPRGAVVVIDTTAKAAPGSDENSGQDMGLLLDTAERLAAKIDGLVWLVGHTGKDATRGWRGWSGAIAAFDAAIETSGDRNKLNKVWRSDKVKDGAAGGEHPFMLEVIDLGMDEDGDPVSSCVVEPGDRNTPAREKKLAPSLRCAMESFYHAALASGNLTEDEFYFAVHLDDWRPEFYSRSTAESPDAKRVAFNRARKELVHLGRLKVSDDIYRVHVTDQGFITARLMHGTRETAQRNKVNTA